MTNAYDDWDDFVRHLDDDPEPYTFDLPPVRRVPVKPKSVIREMQDEAKRTKDHYRNRSKRDR